MPDVNGNPTIGDVITADVSATSNQVNASSAAAAADKALTDANAAKTAADAALASGLAKVGPTFTIDTNGNVTVYLPDSTSAGFHTITPVNVNTPLPAAPTPPAPPSN